MFEQLAEQIILVIFGLIITAVLGFFAALRKCLTKIDKRTFRQSTAMMTMATESDKITNRLHPKEDSDIAKAVERQLRDSEGNL
jgi:hypothetical protein